MGDKHDFLQADSIAFTGHSKACLKYPEWKVCNIFAISQKKKKGITLIFLHADQHQTFLQVDTINLGGHGQAYTNYTK